jgi:hypothetical protein
MGSVGDDPLFLDVGAANGIGPEIGPAVKIDKLRQVVHPPRELTKEKKLSP